MIHRIVYVPVVVPAPAVIVASGLARRQRIVLVEVCRCYRLWRLAAA